MDVKLDDFFENTNIFITGGTGFIGKMLIEKLLRSQTNINKLYILIRAKKDKDAEDRAKKDIFDQPIFQQVKEINPDYMDKVVIMQGDITEPRLGLSEENVERILDEINIVYSSAASVKLQATLKHSVQNNVKSVLELLELCRRMKSLKSVVMVSTAYSNCNRKVVEEKIYPAPISGKLAISLCEELEDDVLAGVTKLILNDRQNTYLLSKSIMEDTLRYYNDLPIVLFRPGPLTVSYQEPVPGWADNFYGPLGVYYSIAAGLLRVTPFNGRCISYWTPVDLCTNALICSAWHGVRNRPLNNKNKVAVYNYASAAFKRPLHDFINALNGKNIRLQKCSWKHMMFNVNNRCLYYILLLVFQYLPALILDIFSIVTRNKMRFNKTYNKKIVPFLYSLVYLANNELTLDESNTTIMWESLDEVERKRYNFDSKNIDFDSYMTSFWIGIKVYLGKEDMKTNATALQKHKMLDFIHYVVMLLFAILASWIFYSIFVHVLKF